MLGSDKLVFYIFNWVGIKGNYDLYVVVIDNDNFFIIFGVYNIIIFKVNSDSLVIYFVVCDVKDVFMFFCFVVYFI